MSTPLDYQQSEATRFRLPTRWLAAVLLVALSIFGIRVLITITRRLVMEHAQNSALADTTSSNMPVFDTRPESLPLFQRSDPHFKSGTIDSVPYIARLPASWTSFLSSVGSTSHPVALIAARKMRWPGGQERMVAIEAFHSGNSISLWARQFQMGSWRAAPTEAFVSQNRGGAVFGLSHGLTIYALPPDQSGRLMIRVHWDWEQVEFEAKPLASNGLELIELKPIALTPPLPPTPASSRPSLRPAFPAPLPGAQ